MPKRAKELSAAHVRRLTKPGFYAVGGVAGLHLQVRNEGARSWILRVKYSGARRDIGLGPYPDVGLEKARQRAREARQQIWEGIDPLEAKRAAQAALMVSEATALTFEQAARRCHAAKASEFRSARHAHNWLSSLERYAFPKIGALPVDAIDVPHVLAVLQPIWSTKTDTARRVRQRMEAVLSWAKVARHRTGDNPAAWRDNLQHALANPSKVHKVTHYPALPWQEVGAFMAELRQREGMAARALEFIVLTWARSGEVRMMTWDEVDLRRSLWTVPAERMKAGREHKVPLSPSAVALLKSLPRREGSPFVFWAPRGGALSDMSISAVCRRMKVDAVPHGFRSTAKDWARNSTSYADEVSELQLAHVSSDATRAAYARDELLDKRARMMTEWARYLERKPGKRAATPIRRAQ